MEYPQFNFRKANWKSFTKELDNRIKIIESDPKNYEAFQKLVLDIAKNNIPRSCRKTYIPCQNDESKQICERYIEAYNRDPLCDETIQPGEKLVLLRADEISEHWRELITSVDMTHNSKKAWSMIKKINCKKRTQTGNAAVIPDEVAIQLLQNRKSSTNEKGYQKRMRTEIDEALAECND